MNIPSPPKFDESRALSKSWNPKSTLQSLMENMELVPDKKSRNQRRSALDPFREGKEFNHPSPCVIIPAQKEIKRRNSLGDALGPNFGGKPKEEESSRCYAPLITKKRTNVCTTCGATDTPSWRRSKDDHRVLLCNACGLRNRSVRKRHKGEQRSKTEEELPIPFSAHLGLVPLVTSRVVVPLSAHLVVRPQMPSSVVTPLSPHLLEAGPQMQSPVVMPLSPVSPLIPSSMTLSNQNSMLSYNDPFSMFFWDDLNLKIDI